MGGPAIVWEEMVKSHQHYVYNLAYYLSQDPHEADDLTQETFLKAFEHLEDFRQEAGLRTWLCSIALNTFKASRRRKRIKHQSMCLEKITLPDSSFNTERIVIRKELQWCIHHVLQYHVSREQKIILVLRDLNEMSYKEIASVLGISVSAVKSRVNRARMAFKNHLVKSGCAKLMKDFTCYCEGVLEV
ncbi:MAG: hypothetical protein VR69_16435 [Peptococcaceae bacterium BRH_c4b]|nr:MAG: hypothetical protein VR69_16435 [Peptococcaceae bacterium BRH_c4b]